MQITVKAAANPDRLRTACLVVGLGSGPLRGAARAVDAASGGLLRKLRERGDIKGEAGQTLLLPSVPGVLAERVLLVGTGEGKKPLKESDYRKLQQALVAALLDSKADEAHTELDDIDVDGRDHGWQLTQLAMALTLREYRYTETLSKPKPAIALRKLTIGGDSSAALRAAVQRGLAIGHGMNVARRLGDLPANICTPTFLASEARALGRKRGLKVSVLNEKQMEALGMGSLLSVAAGTEQPARLIVFEYHGGKRGEQPQVLVGKGITFDTGGISLKPGAKMDEMKYDMCGAASVFGALSAVAELALPVNVVGIVAATENMPSGVATKPGDVVKSMSGQTIEILNTDAEGRLVLCDALTYAARFKPAAVIDIATLTGACVAALGKIPSGLFSNQDDFARELLDAGTRIGDRAWQLPLWEEYQKQLDSNFADMANIGSPFGGAITAASFLARFTRDYRWAHLDIAGTAWDDGAAKGATGRPVGLLTQYLIDRCDK